MIKVLVNGAHGRLGGLAVQAVREADELTLAGTAGRTDDLSQAIADIQPDVVVDFTVASAGFANTRTILEAGARPVVGTSGFQRDQVAQLQTIAAANRLGGVIAPNFSIAGVLIMDFARRAARYLPQVEIVEVHHPGKEESPSGMALRTAEMIAEGRRTAPTEYADRPILPGARGATLEGVHLHALRLPGVVARQRVLFGGLGETLEIEHQTLDRQSFMPGVCLACRRVVEVEKLYHGLEHLL